MISLILVLPKNQADQMPLLLATTTHQSLLIGVKFRLATHFPESLTNINGLTSTRKKAQEFSLISHSLPSNL
jgi:hypothetical protein